MAKSKVLSINKLKELDAKNFNEKKVLNINGYDFTLDIHFRESKIQEMLKDMVQKVKELSDQFENENEKMDCFTTIFSFVDFFIIKHFTNLSSELNGLDIKNTINVFNMLQDNGFRTEIINYFNENCVDEIDKIKIMLDNFGKNITEMTKDMQKSFDDSLDTIEKATNTSAEDIQVVENEKHRLKMDEKTDTISFVE